MDEDVTEAVIALARHLCRAQACGLKDMEPGSRGYGTRCPDCPMEAISKVWDRLHPPPPRAPGSIVVARHPRKIRRHGDAR